MFKKFWGKTFLTNHYKLLIVSSEQSEPEKNLHFKTLKMDKIPATTQIFLAQIMKFPDFWYLKICWPICKIPRLFPDLEEKSIFPEFSLTSGHPEDWHFDEPMKWKKCQ